MALYDDLMGKSTDFARMYKGDKVISPLPVMDGLKLWYDFKGRTNTDSKRDVAVDLSGTGNHGTMSNFAYTLGSGYQSNKEVTERNLLVNTDYHSLPEGRMASTQVIGGSPNSALVLRDGTAGWGIISDKETTFVAGKTYTATFELKTAETTRLNYNYIMSNSGNISLGTSVSIIPDGEWHEYNLTFTASQDRFGGLMLASDFRSGAGESFEIRKLRMQEGNETFPWSPAPEDDSYEAFGHSDRYLDFDGIDDRIYVPHNESLTIPETLTIEILLKLNKHHTGYSANISKQSTTLDSNYNFYVFGNYMDNGGQGNVSFYATKADRWGVISSSIRLELGVEYHIAVSYDSVLGGQMYINGIPHGGRTLGGTLATNNSQLSFRPSYMGMKSFRIYNKTLSASEILHNYNMEKERWGL